ncbi:MAG: DNA repair protein RecO [Gammaproteobacteria bacterium]|jgi:DNA repair protein RecO (recombination protein O)
MRTRERVHLHPAYVLHHYPWRDTSRMVELFTQQFGRVPLIARGARRAGSALRPLLQPFRPVVVSWSARGDLGNLIGAEPAGAAVNLAGEAILMAFYANELIIRLLVRHDPHPALFERYTALLPALAAGRTSGERAGSLRLFEKALLEDIGYGLLLETTARGEAIEAGRLYQYHLEEGPAPAMADARSRLVVSGRSLLDLAAGRLEDETSLVESRRLLRAALDLYLGGRPLKTRDVTRALRRRPADTDDKDPTDE